MEKVVWTGHIKPGSEDEYDRRHAQFWPDMQQALAAAGICNYTIWRDGCRLIGYYECEKGAAFAQRVQQENPTVVRWEAHMKDILIKEENHFLPVFSFRCDR